MPGPSRAPRFCSSPARWKAPSSRPSPRRPPKIVAAGYSVRMIVAQTDADAMPRGWALSDAVEVDCEVRWARKPRLIEAHEQLVLGPQTCWIGDSMRREPAKCDAYETILDDCAETAASAMVSFERLWQTSEPLLAGTPVPPRGDETAGSVRAGTS